MRKTNTSWKAFCLRILARTEHNMQRSMYCTVFHLCNGLLFMHHDNVIKWKHFPRNWPFVRGIHRSRWFPHTKPSDAELWCFLWSASLWINDWVNNREAGDLRRNRCHYDVIVMIMPVPQQLSKIMSHNMVPLYSIIRFASLSPKMSLLLF